MAAAFSSFACVLSAGDAIAQFGSLAITSRNAFSAAEYANECKSATARSNSFCTSAEQEVGNFTTPSFSGTGWSCSPATANDSYAPHADQKRQIAKAVRTGKMRRRCFCIDIVKLDSEILFCPLASDL